MGFSRRGPSEASKSSELSHTRVQSCCLSSLGAQNFAFLVFPLPHPYSLLLSLPFGVFLWNFWWCLEFSGPPSPPPPPPQGRRPLNGGDLQRGIPLGHHEGRGEGAEVEGPASTGSPGSRGIGSRLFSSLRAFKICLDAQCERISFSLLMRGKQTRPPPSTHQRVHLFSTVSTQVRLLLDRKPAAFSDASWLLPNRTNH